MSTGPIRRLGGLPLLPPGYGDNHDVKSEHGFRHNDRFEKHGTFQDYEVGRLYPATVDETGSPRFSDPRLLRGQPALRQRPPQPAQTPAPPPVAPQPQPTTPAPRRANLVADTLRPGPGGKSFRPKGSAHDFLQAKARGYRGSYDDFLAG